MAEDERPKREESTGNPPPPTDNTVSKGEAAVTASFSPASQSSEKVWVQSVENSKTSADGNKDKKLDEEGDTSYKSYEKPIGSGDKKEPSKDIETGNSREDEEGKRASFASSASSGDSSGASELAALKREMTLRKSRMDIETLTLMAKLEAKKKKQRQRNTGLGVFVILIGVIFGIIFALGVV
ncbi:MAG: hypothetical protein SGBAC_002463 [Bacillariaceae sp.]